MAGVQTVQDKSPGAPFRRAASFLRALVQLPKWIWVAPFGVSAVILIITLTPVGWITNKPIQEIAAPVVIGLTAGLSIAVHYHLRQLFSLMLACFAVALFLRELHFTGTTFGLYTTVFVLAVWGTVKWERIRNFAANREIASLLVCAVWTYLIAKAFDRHYMSFLPNYYGWHDNVEETLESFGHLMVFVLVVATLRLGTVWQTREAADKT